MWILFEPPVAVMPVAVIPPAQQYDGPEQRTSQVTHLLLAVRDKLAEWKAREDIEALRKERRQLWTLKDRPKRATENEAEWVTHMTYSI